MALKNIKKTIILGVFLWALPKLTLAHRLDELLQSSYIMIAPDKISIEIVLTPGATIASGIFRTIDNNHDGKVSIGEKKRYAQKVLSDINLRIDNEQQRLILFDVACSPLQDLKEGIGKIRLLVSATTKDDIAEHRLEYINTFEAMRSVYTINALMPEATEIQILTQERDRNQFGIGIAYKQLVSNQPHYKLWLFAGVFTMLPFLLFLTFKRPKNTEM